MSIFFQLKYRDLNPSSLLDFLSFDIHVATVRLMRFAGIIWPYLGISLIFLITFFDKLKIYSKGRGALENDTILQIVLTDFVKI